MAKTQIVAPRHSIATLNRKRLHFTAVMNSGFFLRETSEQFCGELRLSGDATVAIAKTAHLELTL